MFGRRSEIRRIHAVEHVIWALVPFGRDLTGPVVANIVGDAVIWDGMLLSVY